MPGPLGIYEAVFGEAPNRGNNINISKVDSSSMPPINSNNKSASIFGLIGSLISSFVNIGLSMYQNRHNEELARKQNAWNREQWRLETAYNSPLAQIERLRQAGLNPGLVYGNGIENLAATSPEMVSSQGQAPSFGNPFSNFAQNAINERLADSNIQLQESQAHLNDAQASNIESEISARSETQEREWIRVANETRTVDSNISKVNVEISQLQSYKEYLDSQKSAQDFLNSFNKKTENLRIQLIESEKFKNIAEANRAKAEETLLYSQDDNEKIYAALNTVALVRDKQQFMKDQIALYLYLQKYGSFPEWDELKSFHYSSKSEYEAAKTLATAYSDPRIRSNFLHSMYSNSASEARHAWWNNSFYGSFYNDWNGIAAGVIGEAFNGNVSVPTSRPHEVVGSESRVINTSGGKRVIRSVIRK